MLCATTFFLLTALVSQPDVDLSIEGLPMRGQELTLVVRTAPRTAFRLYSSTGTSLGVTDQDGLWQHTFRPTEAGETTWRVVARGADGAALDDQLDLDVREAYVPGPGDVVLSEIHRTEEWIELFNRTQYDLDLTDWTLRDDDGDLYVIADLVLPARSHLVLALDGVRFVLDDVADEVVLTDTEGRDLDRVAYDVFAGWPASDPGESLTGSARGPGGTLAQGGGNSASSLPNQPEMGGFCAAPPTPGAPNGCCTGSVGAEDLPDLDFVDSNCDGIDGDVARALFVSPTGASSNPGTMDEPLDSIQAAIDAAAQDPARDHVYVSEGTYLGTVFLEDGVSVWGGFSETNDWQRSGAFTTTIRGETPVAEGLVGVRGTWLSSPTTLGSMRVETADAGALAAHTYGVLLQFCNNVTLEAVVAAPGDGSDGQPGAPGQDGGDGWPGGWGKVDGTAGTAGAGQPKDGGSGGRGSGMANLGQGLGEDGEYGDGWGGYGGSGGVWLAGGSHGGHANWGGWTATAAPPSNIAQIVNGALLVNGTGGAGKDGWPGSGGGGGGGGGSNFWAYTGAGGGGGGGGGGPGLGGGPERRAARASLCCSQQPKRVSRNAR